MRSCRSRLALACCLIVLPSAAPCRGQAGLPAPVARDAQGVAGQDAEVAAVDSHWARSVREDLVAEKFDELESMAAQYRAGKSRVPGGGWQLRLFYAALNTPRVGDTSMPDHLAHLQHWMAARPQSVTAAVAYAGSMTKWAWQARTSAQADKVTEEGVAAVQGTRRRCSRPRWTPSRTSPWTASGMETT